MMARTAISSRASARETSSAAGVPTGAVWGAVGMGMAASLLAKIGLRCRRRVKVPGNRPNGLTGQGLGFEGRRPMGMHVQRIEEAADLGRDELACGEQRMY